MAVTCCPQCDELPHVHIPGRFLKPPHHAPRRARSSAARVSTFAGVLLRAVAGRCARWLGAAGRWNPPARTLRPGTKQALLSVVLAWSPLRSTHWVRYPSTGGLVFGRFHAISGLRRESCYSHVNYINRQRAVFCVCMRQALAGPGVFDSACIPREGSSERNPCSCCCDSVPNAASWLESRGAECCMAVVVLVRTQRPVLAERI